MKRSSTATTMASSDTHHAITIAGTENTCMSKRMDSNTSRKRPRPVDDATMVDGSTTLTSASATAVSLHSKNPMHHASITVPRIGSRDHADFRKRHPIRHGAWTEQERLLFLKGLQRFGLGKWKEIGTLVTTRYVRSQSGRKVDCWLAQMRCLTNAHSFA